VRHLVTITSLRQRLTREVDKALRDGTALAIVDWRGITINPTSGEKSMKSNCRENMRRKVREEGCVPHLDHCDVTDSFDWQCRSCDDDGEESSCWIETDLPATL
jgi:hypothetical protein